MSAAVANVRRHSVFLTRSLLLSNPPNHLSSSIRRSSSPYRVSTSTSHVPARAFSSSSHASSSPSSTSIPHISLHIAASSSGKGRRFRPDANTQEFSASSGQSLGAQRGSSLQEKRRSRPDSGQDAYFVAPVGSHSHSTTPQSTAFAIADGVGGWTDRGIDPADFSHGLCTYMSSLAQSFNASDSEPSLSPKRLLARGYQQLINDPDMVGGGTTACVGVIDPSGRMRIANLGDSGFVQLRLGRVQHLSEPQTHAFNTPYQLSLTPPEILRQAHIFGGVPIDDKPGSAEDFDLGISHGDVLVLATDGVWDNLDAQDLLKIVGGIMRGSGAWELHGEHGEQGFAVSDHIRDLVSREKGSKESQMPETLQGILAATIVGEAKNASLNEKRDGPFAKALRKYYPEEGWRGGKVDDIAVLVIVGVEEGGEANLKAKL